MPWPSGATFTDGWSALLPDGFVIVDEFTSFGRDGPIPLETWIDSEIEWMKVAQDYMDADE